MDSAPCANPECEFLANGNPEISLAFCCEKCEGRFNGEEWAMTCKKKHTAYCTSKIDQEPTPKKAGGGGAAKIPAWKGGGGGMADMMAAMANTWSCGKCALPDCNYMAHSDPTVSPGYCCPKCEALHAGEEWAEGGKRHYKCCEKREVGSGPPAPAFPKGMGGKGAGPYMMPGMAEMAEMFGAMFGEKGYAMFEEMGGKAGKAGKGQGGGIVPPRIAGGAAGAGNVAKGGQGAFKGGHGAFQGGFLGGKDAGKGKGGGKCGKPNFAASQKVWIGNIAEGADRDALRAHCAEAGVLPKVVSVKGRSGMLAFGTDMEASEAMIALAGSEFGGQLLEVDVWTTKE